MESSSDPEWQQKWLKLDLYNDELRAYAARCEAFAKRAARNSTGPRLFVVSGPCGNGKTHAVKRVNFYFNAVALHCYEKGYWGKTTKRVPCGIFAGWTELCQHHETGLWHDALRAELTIADDVGTETDRFRSGEPIEWLRDFLSQRAGKFTIITTNVPPDQWGEKWGPRVEDRLLRDAEHVSLTTGSYARRNV